jgi:hypothetical protein
MTTDSLGAFQREYSASAQGRYEVISGGIIGLVVLGIATFGLIYSKPGQFWWGIVLIGVLGGALGYYIYGGIRKLGRSVLFYDDGMILRDGSKTDVIRFDEVAALVGMLPVDFRGAPVHVGGPMSIELYDGRRFHLPFGYADADVLANFLHEKVLAQLLPAAVEKLQRGEVVNNMGALSVDRFGVKVDGKSIPWSEFRGVTFTADDLILQSVSGQPWTTLKIAKVPNANLFLHLTRGTHS